MNALAAADISLFEGFRLDRRAGVLFRRDQQRVFVPIAIGRRALDLLGVLVERPGDLISRDEIIEAVWPGTTVEDSNLNVQIAALRRILDDGRAEGSCIQTVSGRGYRFVAAVTRSDAGPPQSGMRPLPRLSIVVLPFTNLSDDREQQYFADGITEDLTTDLSRIAGSFVISCNTAFTYRGRQVGAKQIGRELGVRYVLEGSVRRSRNQIRVNAQLIDAESDMHLWAERFNGDTSDMFALQDEITSRIAVTLNLELVRAEAARPTQHPDALDYILRGRAVALKPHSRSSYEQQITLFEHALTLDAHSVEAQSWLAGVLASRAMNGMTDSAAADIARAEALAAQALATAPRSPLAHFARGQVLRVQGRLDEAISEYETALASNQNWVDVFAAIGRCKIFLGPIEEAIPAQEQAIRLSPRDPAIGLWYLRIGQAHLLQSRVDEAILWFEKARGAAPEIPFIRAYLASAYALHGDAEHAAAQLAEAQTLDGAGNFSSIAGERVRQSLNQNRGARPEIRALFEATYFAGLRKAGMPEE